MPALLVSDELRSYLIAEGVGVAGSSTPGALPTVWLQPRDGALTPRRLGTTSEFVEPATVTINTVGQTVPQTGAEFVEETIVDIRVRALQHSTAQLLQRRIYDLLVDSCPGGRELWTMGGLLVQYSRRFRGDQFVSADADSYERVQSILFGCRRESLAGL